MHEVKAISFYGAAVEAASGLPAEPNRRERRADMTKSRLAIKRLLKFREAVGNLLMRVERTPEETDFVLSREPSKAVRKAATRFIDGKASPEFVRKLFGSANFRPDAHA